MNSPLSGLTLVELNSPGCPLALRLSAALAARIAADLGAEVIKLEPADGDPTRALAPLIGDTGAAFAFLNAGKKSLRLPRDDDGARDVARRLIARAELAVIDDAVPAWLGDGAQSRRAMSVLSMTAPGLAPARAQSEFTVMALGGLLDIVGDPAREPLRLGGYQLAYSAGLAAYAGLVAALCQAKGSGACEIARANLLDVAVWLNWKTLVAADAQQTPPRRAGKDAEWRALRCADGWVALVHRDADWPALRELGGDPRLDDEKFQTGSGRRRNARALSAILEPAFLRLTRREIRDLALKKRIPLGAVWSPSELERDPQMLAREFFRRVPVQGGAALIARLPVLWNGQAFAPGAIPSPVARDVAEAAR